MLYKSKKRLGLVVLLAGLCGGLSVAHAMSPFVGRWRGGWHDMTLGQIGTLRFTVRPNGAFTGNLRSNSGSLNGSWTGSISDEGSIRADYAYTSGDKAGAGATSFRAVGNLRRNAAGHLVGRLSFVRGKQPFDDADFDLVRETDAPEKASLRRRARHHHGASQTPRFPSPEPSLAPTVIGPDAVVLYDPYDLAH